MNNEVIKEDVRVLANELIAAVAKDEQGEGCDIAAGLLGVNTSRWVVELAARLRGAAPTPVAGDAVAKLPEGTDQFAIGDMLYRINAYGLAAGLSDADFRRNVAPILEDIRGWLSGVGYEVQPEQLPCKCSQVKPNPNLCPDCKTWPVDAAKCQVCGKEKPFYPAALAQDRASQGLKPRD